MFVFPIIYKCLLTPLCKIDGTELRAVNFFLQPMPLLCMEDVDGEYVIAI